MWDMLPAIMLARVIARPFIGQPAVSGALAPATRLAARQTLLDCLKAAGLATIGVGKIPSIFDFVGITDPLEAHDNAESFDQTVRALDWAPDGIIFVNLVDFDMFHRRDSEGSADNTATRNAKANHHPRRMSSNRRPRLDPPSRHDHTRGVLSSFMGGGRSQPGTRSTGHKTIAENFGLQLPVGKSFLSELR
jgi:phosphopentomutase